MSLKANYIYNTLNRILKILIAIISVPYVSRILGSDNLGIYSYTYTTASYFVLFILLGLDNYGNREIAKAKIDQKSLDNTFSEIYSMQLIGGIAIALFYILFCFFFANKYQLFFYLQIIYIFSSLIDVNWALSGLEEFKFTAVRGTFFNVLSLILIFLLVRNHDSLFQYALILLSLSVINNAIGWFYVRKRISFKPVNPKNTIKHIMPNIVLFIPIVAVSLYKMMDKIMLGSMSEINQVGFYENSEKIVQIPTMLISSLGTVMLPRMTSLFSTGKIDIAKGYIEKSIDAAMIISTAMCFGIMGVSKEFVPIYYGQGFELCEILYLILLPCCILLAFSNVIRTQFLIPQGKEKIYIRAVISGAVFNVIINIILIPRLGAIGAAIGTFIAELTVCFTQTIGVRNDLPVINYVKRSIPFIVCGLIMFLSIYFINFNISNVFMLIIKIIIGATIYCAGMFFINLIFKDKYDFKLITDIIRKKR